MVLRHWQVRKLATGASDEQQTTNTGEWYLKIVGDEIAPRHLVLAGVEFPPVEPSKLVLARHFDQHLIQPTVELEERRTSARILRPSMPAGDLGSATGQMTQMLALQDLGDALWDIGRQHRPHASEGNLSAGTATDSGGRTPLAHVADECDLVAVAFVGLVRSGDELPQDDRPAVHVRPAGLESALGKRTRAGGALVVVWLPHHHLGRHPQERALWHAPLRLLRLQLREAKV